MPIVIAEERVNRRRDRRALWLLPAGFLVVCLVLAVPLFHKVELRLGGRRMEASCFELVDSDRVSPLWRPGLNVMPDDFMQHPRDTRAVYLRVGNWVYFTFWVGRDAPR